MNRHSIKFIIVLFAIMCGLLLIYLKYIVMWEGVYKDNELLSKKVNKEIKTLALNVIKDNHSKIYSLDKSLLYTEEYLRKDISLGAVRSVFTCVDSKFMDTVEKVSENKYTLKIQLKQPDDWCYYFNISDTGEKFLVSFVGIDP